MESIDPQESTAPAHGRWLHLACVAVIAVAVVGFFVGLRPARQPGDSPAPAGAMPPSPTQPPSPTPPTPLDDAQPSLRYAELRSTRIGPNRTHRSALASLVSRALR